MNWKLLHRRMYLLPGTRPGRWLAALAALAVAVFIVTGVTASADTTGFNSSVLCTSNSPGLSSPPDACDTMHDGGGHGIDIHTSQNNTGALCVYDYAGNPSSCLQTLGGAFDGFGRTATGTSDGDSVDSYGNGDVFTVTNRILSNGGLVVGGGKSPAPYGQAETDPSGDIAFCPAGDLVGGGGQIVNPACRNLTGNDVQGLHSMEAVPSWTVLTLANGWQERGSGFPSLAVSLNATPPDDAQLLGQVKNGTFANGEQIASVPSSLTPKSEQTLTANCGAGTVCEVTVEISGAVAIWSTASSVNLIQVNSTYVTDR
jgi:hypothetical protein